MKAIIVGGGIGGLTTALMLHARGIDCEIFEQADAVRELGVGINTLPHAIKELAELGLLPRLDDVGIRTHELFYMNRDGQEIWREPRGTDAGFDFPQFSIHRGRLQAVIYQAVRARLGESRIHTGHRLGSFTQDEGGVTAYFFGRDGSHRVSTRGDVLIGADGIHSFVRETLYPNEGPARWNGSMLWRGAIEWPKFLTGRSMVIAGGMAGKLVIYPIAEGPRVDRPLTNWAVLVKVAEAGVPPDKADWSRPGRFEDLMPHVQRFRIPFVDARALIEATPEFWEYPMCDRDPLPRWTHSRVTLLGDAAHPMYPVGSNGASQAILDARVLTREILTHGPTNAALSAYEAERRPATTDLVMLNRRNGPEQVMQLVEERAPNGYSVVTDVLSLRELEDIAANYKRVAGFQVEGLNAKPSIVQIGRAVG
jgi:2-polyprenyl-6-methoxyphenol hydroxylase-like FAD-dependent oxidoreductase